MKPGSRPWVTPPILAGVAVVALVGVFVAVPPLQQDAGFHRFADRRSLLGVANALDVLSNLPLLLVGLLGVLVARDRRCTFVDSWERLPWLVMFGAVAATGVGSGLYHLAPSNTLLVWDRLPQTLITMGLLTAVIAERVSLPTARRIFGPLLAAGAASVFVWIGTGDLRLYAVVQFLPTIVIPLVLLANPPRYTRGVDLWIALGWYVVARLCELLDYEIYADLGLSGHTLKHVAAAASVWWLVRMVRRRAPVNPGAARLSSTGSPTPSP